jgi:hypothetical protein
VYACSESLLKPYSGKQKDNLDNVQLQFLCFQIVNLYQNGFWVEGNEVACPQTTTTNSKGQGWQTVFIDNKNAQFLY